MQSNCALQTNLRGREPGLRLCQHDVGGLLHRGGGRLRRVRLVRRLALRLLELLLRATLLVKAARQNACRVATT